MLLSVDGSTPLGTSAQARRRESARSMRCALARPLSPLARGPGEPPTRSQPNSVWARCLPALSSAATAERGKRKKTGADNPKVGGFALDGRQPKRSIGSGPLRHRWKAEHVSSRSRRARPRRAASTPRERRPEKRALQGPRRFSARLSDPARIGCAGCDPAHR
jgi:hypothetical protein